MTPMHQLPRHLLEAEHRRAQRLERYTRFWLLMTRPEVGCWEWQGHRTVYNYGQFERNTKAHRLAYELAVGEIPDGMLVCHRCDNPPCCRPDHLFLGDKEKNGRDMAAKGRARTSRFTPDEIRSIRAMVKEGHVQRQLARALDVHPTTINRIVRERTWKEVAP